MMYPKCEMSFDRGGRESHCEAQVFLSLLILFVAYAVADIWLQMFTMLKQISKGRRKM